MPLALVTALLVSMATAPRIEYTIHPSDRIAPEVQRGTDVDTAYRGTLTGIDGALLGSALPSGAAFALAALVCPA